uniref:Very-long-chain 3-oxoacyl-CoA synthase n=1 Tax=Panagrolaimus davidi TaxID=227884 RepID=A0A914QUQ1_9BILA
MPDTDVLHDWTNWKPKFLVEMFPINNRRIINNYCSFSTSMLVHILLLYAIITQTPKIFKPYQKVLFLHLVMNFYYTFVGLLIQSNMVYDRSTDQFFVQIDALIKNPSMLLTVIMTGFNDFGSLWYISAMPVNYVYRYFLICR